jgi:hypothetical protein
VAFLYLVYNQNAVPMERFFLVPLRQSFSFQDGFKKYCPVIWDIDFQKFSSGGQIVSR